MANLFVLIIRILFGKEAVIMMAMLYAQKIMLGKITFASVPAKLKAQVKEILEESGVPELAEE